MASERGREYMQQFAKLVASNKTHNATEMEMYEIYMTQIDFFDKVFEDGYNAGIEASKELTKILKK